MRVLRYPSALAVASTRFDPLNDAWNPRLDLLPAYDLHYRHRAMTLKKESGSTAFGLYLSSIDPGPLHLTLLHTCRVYNLDLASKSTPPGRWIWKVTNMLVVSYLVNAISLTYPSTRANYSRNCDPRQLLSPFQTISQVASQGRPFSQCMSRPLFCSKGLLISPDIGSQVRCLQRLIH